MKYCINCGKEIPGRNKYCDNTCQNEYEYKIKIQEWKDGKFNGLKGADQLSNYLRRYIFEKFGNKCCECGWSKTNTYSGLVPLQVHHKDGDCLNNLKENLVLLCPNCHSLTENYGNRNGKSTRIRR